MHIIGNHLRKTIALLLSIMLLVNLIPMTALADIRSTINNTPEQNQAILDSLRQLYGDEVTTEATQQELEELGLLDDNGEIAITATIDVDGEQLTLDQVRQLVFSPDTDLGKLVSVDGTPITLGDLKLMIEIEDELQRIQDTYFNDVTLTPEQQASLDSLRAQIESEGITVAGLENPELVFPSGVDHAIYIEVAPSVEFSNATQAQTVSVTLKDGAGATLTRVPNYDISVSYRFVDGSAVSGVNYLDTDGIITFPANSFDTTQRISFDTLYDDGHWQGQKSFLIQLFNPRNALLQGSRRAAEVQVKISNDYTWNVVREIFTEQESHTGTGYRYYVDPAPFASSDMFTDGLIDQVELHIKVAGQWLSGYCSTVLYFGDYWQYPYIFTECRFDPFELLPRELEQEYSLRAFYSPSMLADMVQNYEWGLNNLNIDVSQIRYQWDEVANPDLTLKVRFLDTSAPTVKSVTMPRDILFEYGQSVPITVEYSEPVNLAATQLTVNGEVLTPAEATSIGTNLATFLYPVKQVDGTELNVSDVQGAVDLHGNTQAAYSLGTQTASGIIKGVSKSDAFTGFSAAASLNNGKLQGTVILDLSTDAVLTNWLTAEASMNFDTALNKYRVPSIFASTDGGTTKIDLYANSDNPTALEGSFTPEQNLTDAEALRVIEFYLDPELTSSSNHQLLVGQYALYTVPPAVFLAAGDYSITYPEFPDDGIVFAEDATPLKLSYTVLSSSATWRSPADFLWTSSDLSIATISQDGVIRLTGTPGTVSFTLTALNGGLDGKAVSNESRPLTIKVGLTPFLKIPAGTNAIAIKQGNTAEVRWISNLIAKNAEAGQDTTFAIQLFKADYSTGELLTGELIYDATVLANPDSPVSGHVIPAEYLTDISVFGQYSYVAQVSSPDPMSETGELFIATAHISVLSQPAIVRLAKLPNYFITDETRSVPISWALQYYDTVNGGEFELRVVNNADSSVIYEQTITGDQGGSYSVDIPTVLNGFKDIYTVTVKAKNAADSTWSYDSFVLHVYSATALEIWIDEDSVGSDYTMSNIQRISRMTSSQILAMQRDIHLRNVISINYGSHAWGQISDQIKWLSSDSSIASINYRQGSLYENIENFTYVSYRPATEFILSGLRDGVTQVTATHAATGKQQTVDVQVKTLKDKLYLFQVYPRAVTTLTYTNGSGEKRSVQTNENGALALYEESGIKSDIYLQSVFNDREYRGTIYSWRLVSSEKDSTKLELYPENNFKLREVATVDLYFKLPNGTPYQGDVTLRGGVYKNDQYCAHALLNGLSGEADQTLTLAADGRFTVVMDASQFWTQSDQEVLQPEDRLQFIYEVRFQDDAYYPQLLTVDGNLNVNDIVRFGSGTVQLTAVPSGAAQKPFVESQQAAYPGVSSMDVRNYTGKLGPGGKWSYLSLQTRVLWWGEASDAGQELHDLTVVDQYGTVPGGQSSQTFYYPFATIRATNHHMDVDRNVVEGWLQSSESRSINLQLTDGNGNQYKQLTMPFRIVNMFGAEQAADSASLTFLLQAVMQSSPANASQLGLSDSLLGKGLNYLSGRNIENEAFSMVVRPTYDPTVFKAFIMLSLGNMSEVYEDDQVNEELDYTPGASDVQDMAKGKYLDDQRKLANYNKEHVKSARERDIHYAVGGYMEAEIRYNHEQQKWEILILNGGFNAGGGVSYTWNYNAWVGPVPITAQLKVGGTVEVIFKVSVQRGEQIKLTYDRDAVNNYLTTLRLYAYVRAFGGFGQDYTVAALKIGLFGRVSVDAQFAFLNQPHISSTATKGRKLTVSGRAGVEFVAKFLFVSYKKVLASQSFTLYQKTYGSWNAIQALWTQIGQGSSGYAMVAPAMLTADDSLLYPLAEQAVVEERDYLELFERTWATSSRFSLLSLDAESGLKDLQTNAYPYTNPVLSEDGQLLVYISDANSTAIEDTEVCWTRISGGSYPSGTPIEPSGDGHGDSQLKLAGTAELAAAAWVRQTAELQKEAGEPITYSDVALMSNSTEIMVGIYDGSTWTTTRLTNNATPDLAPVVAQSGDRILVAWRSVYPADATDPLNFSARDSILYRIYEHGVWSETNTLYNGTSGRVLGMEAAMLGDGTTAVTYTIDTAGSTFAVSDTPDGEGVSSGLEAIYAIVGTGGQVQKNVRLTNDSFVDENPQITTVTFDDGNEWFVLGWYSVHDADGVSVSDIRLCAFDRAGTLHTNFIDSISSVSEYANVNISSNFRFAKNAASITDLSILWAEPANSGNLAEGATLADKDLLRAVKFRSDNGRIYITSALDVAEMPDYTLINHFDAYATGDDGVKAVILGTSYDNGYEPTGLLVTYMGETGDLLVATPQSNLYTASSAFENKVEVRSLAVDYEAVVRGMRIPVQFTFFNSGIEPISSIALQVGENTAEFSDLHLLPNSSIALTAYYDIPGDRVINPQYTVTATFADETYTLTDKLYLAIPDVGISKLESLREQDGERLLQVTLYNLSDVQLSGTDRTVKLGFYSDADMTAEVMSPVTISSAGDLALIDAGAFTKQVTFDIQDYLGEGKEIPPGGVRVYAKAWIEEPLPDQPDQTGVILEYYRGNNDQSILFESLLVRHDGEPATISTEQVNEAGVTKVTVTVRNNSLVNVSSGNLIVRLLDSQGNELETLQSYDPEAVNQGLIQLGPEGVAAREFYFSQQADKVTVTYSNAIITDDTNANLATLTLSEIPLKFEAGVTEYSINVREMRSTTVSAVAEDPKATLQIIGQAGGMANVRLHAGWNNITVTVTAADGETKQDYVVMVYNYVPGSEPVFIWPTIIQNPGGTVSYSTSGLVSVTPDQGYCVKDLLVNGKSVGAVTSYQVPSSTVAYRLEALFGPATGLITVKQNNGGTVTVSEDGLSVAITPDEGFRIQDVLVDGVSVGAVNSHDFDPPATPHELEVIFAPIIGTITVSHNAGGTVRASEDGLTVYIAPNRGYRIKDVLVDGASVGAVKSYLFTEPGQEHTVQVVFEPVGDVLAGYTDVANHWAKGVIAFSIERGLLVRTSTTTFSPNLPITRATLVTVLMRLHGGRPETKAQFSDVAASAWYAHSVAWAVENGIADSVGNNAFAPNRVATREELAQIVINYCRFAGIELPQAEVIAFSDIGSVNASARAAVIDMQQAGLMGGRPGNLFDPQGNLTRAEFASVLYRLIVNILGE